MRKMGIKNIRRTELFVAVSYRAAMKHIVPINGTSSGKKNPRSSQMKINKMEMKCNQWLKNNEEQTNEQL
jgi:hypothetical protein